MEDELHRLKAQSLESSSHTVKSPSSSLQEFAKDEVIDERFKIIKLLGRGGMGSVYEIEHLHLHAHYALKILSKGHTNDASWRRFEIEARTTNKLDHPNLIKVHDFGLLPDGQPFFIMDLVEGETLCDVLKKRGRLSVEHAVKLFIQVGFALSYAHSNGIVHRDIKPSNIILTKGSSDKTEDSLVKLVDFGIAKLTGQDGFSQQTLTRTGEIFGSPLYMSPEQCMGVTVDHRSDLYSLGCVFFEALTGTPPLVGDSALSTMMKHQSEAPATLKEASMGIDYPKKIEQVVERLLEKDPTSRYQSAELLTADLVGLDSNQMSTVALIELPKKKTQDSVTMSTPLLIVMGLALYCLGLGIGLIIPPFENKAFEKIPSSFNHKMPAIEDIKSSTKGAKPGRAFSMLTSSFEEESKKTSYFSRLGPGTSRTFNFPFLNIGDYRQGSYGPNKLPWVVPKFSGIYFKPSSEFRNYPQLFRRFRPDEISNLNLSSNRTLVNTIAENASDIEAQLPYLTHLKSMVSFSGADSKLSAKGIDCLNQLSNLVDLRLDRTELSCRELARLKRLPQLSALTLYTNDDVEPVLLKIKNSRAIRVLYLVNCHLDTRQVNLLSGSSVKHLELTNNPEVTNACIDRLPASLNKLNVVGCNITSASAEKFRRLKELKLLYVDDRYWSEKDVQTMRRLMPKTTVEAQQNKRPII